MKRHRNTEHPKEIMSIFPHLEFEIFLEDRHGENDYKCAEDHNQTCDTRRIATHWIGPEKMEVPLIDPSKAVTGRVDGTIE